MTVLRLLAALLLAFSFAACTEPEERAEAAHAAARAAIARGDRSEALRYSYELKRDHPDTPEWARRVAGVLISAGEAPQAVWVLEDAIQRFPDSDELRIALGRVALLVNDMSLAVRAFGSLGADSQYHPDALLGLAQARLGLGDLEASLEVLDQAERLYPDQPAARQARILTLLSEGDVEGARKLVEELDPEADSEQTRRSFALLSARVYGAAKDWNAGIELLRPLVEEDPGDGQAWARLLTLSVRARRMGAFLALVEHAIEERPDEARLYALLGQAHALLDQPRQADEAYRELLDRSETPVSYAAVASHYARTGDSERFEALIDEGIERYPDDPSLSRIRIETLLDDDRIDDAELELERYRELVPEGHALPRYLEARLQIARGELDDAIANLERIVPELDSSAAHYWLGRALELSADDPGAQRRYLIAFQRDQSQEAPLFGLIRLAERRRDWLDVGRYAQAVLNRHPRNNQVQLTMVTSLIRLERLDQAENAARGFAEIYPDALGPQIALARALAAKGEVDEALATLDQAEQRLGASAELEAERAVTLGVGGDTEKAMQIAETALAADPDSAKLHAQLAALAFETGDTERGSAAVDRALELDPEDPLPLRTRASYYGSIGSFEPARADLERYLEARDRDADAWFMLGVVRSGMGDHPAAIDAYRRAVLIDGRQFQARNNLALALAAQGELDEAIRLAQQAYRLAETDAQVIDTLGWIYLQQGLVERAISLLEAAQQADPELADAQYHLALAYRQGDREDDARRLLEELRARIPENDRLYAQTDEALRALP